VGKFVLNRREFLKLLGISAAPLAGGVGASRALARLTGALSVSFAVNNRRYTIEGGKSRSLLDYLRYGLGLTGVKYGCGKGVCGACTVLIQGRAMRSCIIDIQHLDGLKITTIEGLGGRGSLDPIQQTFADLGVFQCGYCAPGIILTTKALLKETPYPSERQIREALYGNLCRCTGYQQIFEAIRAVNDRDYFRRLLKHPYSVVVGFNGDLLARDKVSGRLEYAADRGFSGQLFAQPVFSEHPHARVLSIETEKAAALPGVFRVLTSRDIPGKNRFGSIIPDQPVLVEDRVRCLGDVVALVVAEKPERARAAASLVKVHCQPLPALFEMEKALTPGAPRMTPKGNLCWRVTCKKGSIAEGRAKSAFIEKQVYHTQFVEHAYLETESCVTYIDGQGRMMVRSGSQAPHSYRDQIAAICKIPKEQVVMQTTVAGGAFGAKGDLSVQHLCALATLKTGRPVRLQLTREESIRLHVKRHPFRLEYETGVDRDGNLTFCVVRALADAGAYHSASLAVVENAASFGTGPYSVPHVDVEATAVFTNNPVCGAMRGFGVVQVCLAMERQIDELARKLGRDPLSLRLQNCLDRGKVSQWGQVMGAGTGIGSCLRQLKDLIREAKDKVVPGPNERVGLGVAAGYKNASSPSHVPWGQADVRFILNQHGRFIVYAGGCELGQGFANVIAQFAAAGLGVPLRLVRVVFGSTDQTQSATLTSASQQTFIAGNAALKGGEKFAARIVTAAADFFHLRREDLRLGGKGVVRKKDGKLVASYHEISWRTRLEGTPLVLSYTYDPPMKTVDLPKVVTKIGPEQAVVPSLGYVAQAALVKVNERNGAVKVLKVFSVHDAGRVANYRGVRGQVFGGIVMALGGCLKEELKVEKGRILNDNLDTYTIPRSRDIPEIEMAFVEEADPLGPLGAKGIGELPSLPTAPAVLNAIRDAVGVRLNAIPLSAERIAAELKRKG